MRAFFTLICLVAFSYTTYGQYNFSNANGWTLVDLVYPGSVPPASPRISINSGVLNFINTPDMANDVRCYREVPRLCDNWVSEFEFEATSGNNMFYIPFVLSENNENPTATRMNGATSLTPTDNNAIGAYVLGESSTNAYYIAPFDKLGAQNWSNAPISERIDIDLGVAYHVTFERLNLTQGKITVEDGNGFYETRCFAINPAIGDLRYLQVSNNPVGGWSRYINGWVDTIDIMNCIKKDHCCIGSEIMGLSDLCLPSSNSSFYSVHSGADSYTWSVTGNAQILSGQSTNMIQVDFTNATNPVSISVSFECACTQTVLTKIISCPSVNPNNDNLSPSKNKSSIPKNLLQDRKIEIYPNPSKGTYLLEGVEVGEASYTVTSITGQVVLKKQTVTTNSIDISNQKDGTYLLIISIGEEQRILKLVKQ